MAGRGFPKKIGAHALFLSLFKQRQALLGNGASDMATGQLSGVIRHLRRTALLQDGGGMTDGQLLEGFLTRADEAAFETLVQWYGPMVLEVCRRVLRNSHDAEDAFQATFLILARKAATIRRRESVGSWLHRTAFRAALEVKAAPWRSRERQVSAMPEPEAVVEADVWNDVRPLLDQELDRLPDKYRTAVVLCDLEGKTRKEAAQQLGVPEGTLSGRLTTARRMLAGRLARHGMTVSAGALAAVLSAGAATACVPKALGVSTVKAAVSITAGQAAVAGVVSFQVAAITEGVLKAMLLHKLKLAAIALTAILAVLGLGLLAGDLAGPTAVARQPETKKEPEAKPAESKPALNWEAGPKVDGHKDWVFGIDFSRDGKLMATASRDGTAIIWDVARNKPLVTLQGHEGQVNQIAFSRDGKFVATAGEDKTARVWEVPRGQEVQKVLHEHPVYSVIFAPDGKTLLAGGGKVGQPKRGRREAVEGQGEMRLWDPATGKERGSVTGHAGRVSHLILGSDARMLVSGGSDNTVRLWDWDGKDKLKEKQSIETGTSQGVYGVALTPDGKTLAVATDGGTIKLFDVATAKEKDKLEKVGEGMWDDVTFSSDSKVLASNYWIQERDGDSFMVTRRSRICFWDTTTGKVLQTAEVKEVIEKVAFAPEGYTLVAGGRGKHKFPIMGDVIRLKDGDVEEEKAGPLIIFTPKKDK